MMRMLLVAASIALAGPVAGPSDSIKAIRSDLQGATRRNELDDVRVNELMQRCLALADEAIGTDQELDALVTAVTIAHNARSEQNIAMWKRVIDRLIEGFIDAPKVAEVVFHLMLWDAKQREAADHAITRILQETKSRENQGACLYAQTTRNMAREREVGLNPGERTGAIATVKRLMALGELRNPFGERYQDEAAGNLFELENLHVGAIAPDMTGADLSGVGFKLSDYRGKVVVIDFWGDW